MRYQRSKVMKYRVQRNEKWRMIPEYVWGVLKPFLFNRLLSLFGPRRPHGITEQHFLAVKKMRVRRVGGFVMRCQICQALPEITQCITIDCPSPWWGALICTSNSPPPRALLFGCSFGMPAYLFIDSPAILRFGYFVVSCRRIKW